jgi:hypothetical protein
MKGPDGRRPRVFGAPAARYGQPGYMERLVDVHRPGAVWHIADRWLAYPPESERR